MADLQGDHCDKLAIPLSRLTKRSAYIQNNLRFGRAVDLTVLASCSRKNIPITVATKTQEIQVYATNWTKNLNEFSPTTPPTLGIVSLATLR